MKALKFSLIVIIGVALLSCGQNPAKNDNTDNEQEQLQNQIEESVDISNENFESKFLITNNSAGYFTMDSSWQNFVKSVYNFEYVQGYGTCDDACCDGGFTLGDNIIDSDYGKTIENPEITIGAVSFDQSGSKNKHKSNPDVFYASSDNCSGWYWKDKVSYIVIHSDVFKTKEGIGIGTTLEKVQEKSGKIHFDIGWIEGEANSFQIKIQSYPNLKLILDIDDYQGNVEDIKPAGDKNTITISDFKTNSKIKSVIIQSITQ